MFNKKTSKQLDGELWKLGYCLSKLGKDNVGVWMVSPREGVDNAGTYECKDLESVADLLKQLKIQNYLRIKKIPSVIHNNNIWGVWQLFLIPDTHSVEASADQSSTNVRIIKMNTSEKYFVVFLRYGGNVLEKPMGAFDTVLEAFQSIEQSENIGEATINQLWKQIG